MKYVINNTDKFADLIENLNLEEQKMTLMELKDKISNREVSIVFTVSKKKITATIDYSRNDISQISSELLYLIISYMQNQNFFYAFDYKFEVDTKEDKEELINLGKKLGFEYHDDESKEDKKTFIYFNVSEVFDGTRKIFFFNSDQYLFGRGDEYKKIDFQNFQDIIFLMEKLSIEI